jgi:hypothetical protein
MHKRLIELYLITFFFIDITIWYGSALNGTIQEVNNQIQSGIQVSCNSICVKPSITWYDIGTFVVLVVISLGLLVLAIRRTHKQPAKTEPATDKPKD